MHKFGWPQITMIVFLALGLYKELVHHGEPETGRHNFWAYLVAPAIEITVLKAGGFC